MTSFDTDNLNAPHTLRELGIDPPEAGGVDVSTEAVNGDDDLIRRCDAISEIDCGGCRGECADPANCRMADVAALRAVPSVPCDATALLSDRDRLAGEVARLTAELEAAKAGGGKVKPLMWAPYFNGYCLHADTRIAAYSYAYAITGRYSIGRKHEYKKSTDPRERPFDDVLSSDWWIETPCRKILGPFNSDILAKAAAQADYEARILAAIELAPPAITPEALEQVRQAMFAFGEHFSEFREDEADSTKMPVRIGHIRRLKAALALLTKEASHD